jgi:hypothetical protein
VLKSLAAKGHTAEDILAQAYLRGCSQIDAIDRRIAGYERRRNNALKEEGLWNEGVRQRLKKVDTAIIDGEFTEAAEAA